MQIDDVKLFDACCMAPSALPAAKSWPTRVCGLSGWKGRLRGPMPLQELLRFRLRRPLLWNVPNVYSGSCKLSCQMFAPLRCLCQMFDPSAPVWRWPFKVQKWLPQNLGVTNKYRKLYENRRFGVLASPVRGGCARRRFHAAGARAAAPPSLAPTLGCACQHASLSSFRPLP